VLVFHDLLGFTSPERSTPKFVRRYAALEETATLAVAHFVADVREGRYPSSEETYHMTDQMGDAFGLYGGRSGRPGVPVTPPV
jgi:3-methyl-2-oxobutanoate hydroxymethyltransferase